MRLQDVCTLFVDGDWIESKDQSESGIRLIQTGNIGEGSFIEKDGKERYISVDTFNRLGCTEIYSGDILISRLPEPVGRGCIIPQKEERLITAVDCTICRINEDIVDKRYFCYYLQSPMYYTQLEKSVTGTTRKRISRKNLGSVEINIPDREVQLKVVDVFDRLTRIIDGRNRELEELDSLIKARFVEMFGDPETNPLGWERVRVADVCSSIVRGPFGSALKKDFFVEPDETTYKVYEQKHAIQKSATIGTYYITEEKYKELKRFECVAGDILMSCSGTMGELYQLPVDCERGIINQALCKFTLNTRILPIVFLMYMKQTIGNLETKGSGIQNIAAVSYVKAMPVNLPPLGFQQKFADFVAQVDKLRFVEMLGDISTGEYILLKKLGDVAKVGSSQRVFTTGFG